MAPTATLWAAPTNFRAQVVRAAAAIAGVDVELAADFQPTVTNKTPEYLSKFPLGKAPALETADGFHVFEGVAIARYIAALAPNSTLLGKDIKEAALVDQWVHLAEAEVDIWTDFVRRLTSGTVPYNKPAHNDGLERQTRALKTLEQHISTRTFFVGERITLADLWVAAVLKKAVNATVDAAARPQYPNLVRHLETVVNQPKIKDIFGSVTYIEKGLQYTPPAKEKAPKPAAAPAAPKPKPAKKEVEEEDEPDVPAEPKAKNPLDDLPKSTFNLEDWKRAYSNKETRGPGGALEWFYQNYDPAGFSCWRVDFKYNEELTQTFMSSNQIGGFFNRLEASRKYIFGSVGVLGETNNSVISGVFILRGLDPKPVVDAAPDWESYSYTKLDLNNEQDKAFFEAALAWDLEIDGKKWVDGKNLK